MTQPLAWAQMELDEKMSLETTLATEDEAALGWLVKLDLKCPDEMEEKQNFHYFFQTFK